MQTFYWHDYETWGVDPSRDRACQFAGIRTDLDFNIIGEPLVMYCRPPQDLLPQPEACLITGIAPQLALTEGLSEYEFIAAIHRELSAPGTCGVGYNSIRFDDEVTRYTLYRNFYDPYAREWQNGNSRWDIIDMVRACRALRPGGIKWPDNADGLPSFKLTDLTMANGIAHEHAHDALSDVYATIAIARLIKQKQPKLFDYLFKLRNKREVSALLNIVEKNPVLHISGMFGAARNNGAVVMPLAMHPTNANGVICYDLSIDPTPLIALSAEQIRERVFNATDQLNGERIPLKTIHINKSPVVTTVKMVDTVIAQRIQVDLAKCEEHRRQLLAAKDLAGKLRDVFTSAEYRVSNDPEQMLYSGGFFSDADRATMLQVRKAEGDTLARQTFIFEDKRLPELLWRYRARNFPQTLSNEERQEWAQFCARRLTDPAAGAGIVLDDYRRRLTELNTAAESEQQKLLLTHLADYAETLLNSAASQQ
ncbi:MAG TPA: exodeoxyribonuclease I [Spongiibacteraceae bacterium]|nr:exodeoxyribonuclease I [Spongiibacteraceae bacterium]